MMNSSSQTKRVLLVVTNVRTLPGTPAESGFFMREILSVLKVLKLTKRQMK